MCKTNATMSTRRYHQSQPRNEILRREIEEHELVDERSEFFELIHFLPRENDKKILSKETKEAFNQATTVRQRSKLVFEMQVHDLVELLLENDFWEDERKASEFRGRLSYYQDELRSARKTKGYLAIGEDQYGWELDGGGKTGLDSMMRGDIQRILHEGTPQLADVRRARGQVLRSHGAEATYLELDGAAQYGGLDYSLKDAYEAVYFLYERAEERAKKACEVSGACAKEDLAELTEKYAVELLSLSATYQTHDSLECAEAANWACLTRIEREYIKLDRRIRSGVDLKGIGRFISDKEDSMPSEQMLALRRKERKLDKKTWDVDVVELAKVRAQIRALQADYDNNKSLCETAIDLQLYAEDAYVREQEDYDRYYSASPLNWISDVPFGVIRSAQQAIAEGGDVKAVLSEAAIRHFLQPTELTEELKERAAGFRKYEYTRIESVRKILERHAVVCGDIDLIEISQIPRIMMRKGQEQKSALEDLVLKGYAVKEILENQWIIEGLGGEEEKYPASGSRAEKQKWCVRNAFYWPKNWNTKKLSKVVLSRLEARVDKNLHDATYWLKEFEVPEQREGVRYKDLRVELEFILAVATAPEKLWPRIPRKRRRYETMFSNKITLSLCEQVLRGTVDEGGRAAEMGEIRNLCHGLYHDLKTSSEVPSEFSGMSEGDYCAIVLALDDATREMAVEINLADHAQELPAFTKYAGILKGYAQKRKEYEDQAQVWVLTHSSSPRNILTRAWENRAQALEDGCEDNPRAILQWADLNALRVTVKKMSEERRLPEGLAAEDVSIHKNWFSEMVRCYGGEQTIKAFARMKKEFNSEQKIPAMKIDLGNGWVGEVLPKNDPRGFSIGFDTGCCMTLAGESESCIFAGYREPECGFFALYRDGEILAQSFLYQNEKDDPSVLVCDNIEVCEGRDQSQVISKYQEFWQCYLVAQLREQGGGCKWRAVHLGEGYTELPFHHLDKAELLGLPQFDQYIYSDASYDQRVLNDLSAEEGLLGDIVIHEAIDDRSQDLSDFAETIYGNNERSQTNKLLALGEEEGAHVATIRSKSRGVVGCAIATPDQRGRLQVRFMNTLSKFELMNLEATLIKQLCEKARVGRYKQIVLPVGDGGELAAKVKQHFDVVEVSQAEGERVLVVDVPDKKKRPKNPFLVEEAIEYREAPLRTKDLQWLDVALLRSMEREIYPPEMCEGFEGMREGLQNTPTQDMCSFFVQKKYGGTENSIGYAVAYIEDAETSPHVPVLYVHDVAVLPDCQKHGVGKQAFKRLVEFAKSRGDMPIEFHARVSTSYQAIMHSAEFIASLGYRITIDESMGERYYDEDSEETARLLVLESVERLEEEGSLFAREKEVGQRPLREVA